MNSGAVVLLNDARDRVFELFLQLGKLLEALVDDGGAPVIDLLSVVSHNLFVLVTSKY